MTAMQVFIISLFVFFVIPHAGSIFGDAIAAIIRAVSIAVLFVTSVLIWSA